jgi:hypothetical protein
VAWLFADYVTTGCAGRIIMPVNLDVSRLKSQTFPGQSPFVGVWRSLCFSQAWVLRFGSGWGTVRLKILVHRCWPARPVLGDIVRSSTEGSPPYTVSEPEKFNEMPYAIRSAI